MSIKVAIHHRTEYHFDRLTTINPHIVRLRPAPHSRTPIESYSLKIEPADHFINWQQDPFANYLARLVFPEKARTLIVDVEVIASMTVINPFDFFLEEAVEKFPFKYNIETAKDLAPYLEIKERGDKLTAWLAGIDLTPKQTVNFLVDVNSRLQKDIAYVVRMEPGVQTCEQTLSLAKGSCRDSAWLLVQIFRHLGLAARFVSGYLVQLTADQKSLDGPSGPEADFTDLHAWTEVYLPGAGWVGLDPTSGLFAAEGHIPLACTPSPSTASAIDGSTSKCEVEFKFSNEVRRVHEDPRVTKPYTDDQWQTILALGDKVDERLMKGDVRLTMGGEPTFVSIDDMEGAEWNNAAFGDNKRTLAGNLLLRLKQEFGENGLLHYGQGKWYPGEPLPRWALSLFWRTDKQPLWARPNLMADDKKDYGFTEKDAKAFIQLLTQRLDLAEKFICTGFEDNFHYLMKEGTLPENLQPEDNRLKDPMQRKRLQKVFAQGLSKEVGYVLPLRYFEKNQSRYWQSSEWTFRRGQLYLLPGDSPMGLRLPLDSLPWENPKHRPVEHEKDPFAKRGQLQTSSAGPDTSEKEEPADIIHTALCVEVRGGRLHVFMPPMAHLEHYVMLLNEIEQCCEQLNKPVVLEGYEPPRDPRLKKLQVTPDPGVIEVNIHPAETWRALVSITETIYQRARESRLGTEKFMLDGRHTGTGGGNHVTLGAAKPEDSPFLRRPDLLRSFITYWQNHPSLSYLFSGMFIGPTSQAPRVDEARNDHLHELEIAFQQLPKIANAKQESQQPWLVDRILRNFLVDLTGNTHRSEFCIDKLYSPDSASGRLGLVEFRNFEMPPHPQMSALQMLLLRSVLAWFWEHPYQQKLIRWNTALHDRFMLPYFVWEDLKQVIDDLHNAGYPLQIEWFAPFQEFRFPHYGRIRLQGMELEISSAIEPWHVLGEESTGQGTARYVDSSVERLQVMAHNIDNSRYVVCCNGRPIPLQQTEVNGVKVAGVRFKAWAPWSALHPTINVHVPLVFDVVDTLNKKSIGGCTYHVAHPGGRNYNTFPVNANEAEARRMARFWPHGHTQKKVDIKMETPHSEHPLTLDLRYNIH
jgi:uncharacterized protein (DUF2126 family)